MVDLPEETGKPRFVDDKTAAPLLAGLRYIAAHDPDHVREKNEVGFSLVTHDIGHSLSRSERLTQGQAVAAKRLLSIHRRQLPAPMAKAAGVAP